EDELIVTLEDQGKDVKAAFPELPSLDPEEIRSRWMAESPEPFREPIRRTRMESAKTQLEKLEVLRAIRRGVDVDKSFESKRDSYCSTEFLELFREDKMQNECKEVQKTDRGPEADKFEVGDDRDAEDYESQAREDRHSTASRRSAR